MEKDRSKNQVDFKSLAKSKKEKEKALSSGSVVLKTKKSVS